MSSTRGKRIKLTIFGESHGEYIGGVLEGMKAGMKLDFNRLKAFMKRRLPGLNDLTSQRKEKDDFVFLSGLDKDIINGFPLSFVIKNNDSKSNDYNNILNIPRPGHADYTSFVKYGKIFPGGGHFSGRLTAIICLAGFIALEYLLEKNIEIHSRIVSIRDKDIEDYNNFDQVINDEVKMAKEIKDSLGGKIECKVLGLKAGIGDPIFDGLESEISHGIFSIPGVKAIEFGSGFEGTRLFGSNNNDEFYVEDGSIKTYTNNSGGILGGISNGMPIVFTTAIKPTSSIGKIQNSVDLSKMENTKLEIKGRHDPAFILRVPPVIEAMTGLVILDMLMEDN